MPGLPSASFARTRQHIVRIGNVHTLNCEAVTACCRMHGDGNELLSSIWIEWEGAPATSLQSKWIVCPGLKRASFPGERSDGAGSGPEGCGLTVRLAVRVTPPAGPVIVTAVELPTEQETDGRSAQRRAHAREWGSFTDHGHGARSRCAHTGLKMTRGERQMHRWAKLVALRRVTPGTGGDRRSIEGQLMLHALFPAVLTSLLGGPDTARIVAMGDTGLDPGAGAQEKVAAYLEQVAASEPIDFVLLLGDNFYMTGVKSVDDPQWDSKFEKMYDRPHLKVPFVATLGNHDYLGSTQAEIDYARPGTRWVMDPFPFRFSWPKESATPLVDCFAVDTTPAAEAGADAAPQWKALGELLASSKARWKLVFGHHPIFSDGPHGDSPTLAPLRAVLLEKGVDAYLAGHDHILEHLTARDRSPSDRIAYLISGGGSSVYASKQGETARFVASALGFLVLDVTKDTLRLRFHGLDKGVLYDHKLEKTTPPASSPSRKTGALLPRRRARIDAAVVERGVASDFLALAGRSTGEPIAMTSSHGFFDAAGPR